MGKVAQEEKETNRKLCIIFLLDLEGFTKFSSSTDAENFESFMKDFQEKTSKLIEDNGGKIIKYMGDGFLALFDKEKEPLEIAEKLQKDFTNPKAKIFLHIGEVVLTPNDIFGYHVNFAFRMIEAIKGGTIAISEPLYLIIRNKEGFVESPELKVKGVDRPVKIYIKSSSKSSIVETDNVKFLIKEANPIQRLVSFYADIAIFSLTIGILSGVVVKGIVAREIASKNAINKKDEKFFEIQTPIGEIAAGRGKVEIKTEKGELKAETGKIEIKTEEGKVAQITYLSIGGVQVIFFALYLALFWYLWGRTPGEWIAQIKVQKENGDRIGLGTALLRAILLVVLVLPAGLGIILSIIIYRKFSLIHDVLTKTRAVVTG